MMIMMVIIIIIEICGGLGGGENCF